MAERLQRPASHAVGSHAGRGTVSCSGEAREAALDSWDLCDGYRVVGMGV